MKEKDGKFMLTIALIVGGALMGAIAGVAMVFGNSGPVVFILGVFAAFSVMFGSVLALSKFLDETVRPAAQAIQDGMADDLENLQEGSITWPIWQGILTVAATIVYLMLLLRYHKFDATWWGWMPVWIPTVIAIGVLSWIVTSTDWFQDQDFETPAWVYLIAIVGFALALYLGISRTEDTRLMRLSYEPSQGSYNYYHTNYYFFGNSGGSSSSAVDFDMPECSGKSCEGYGYVLLVIFFIILVLILVIGSAFIANFWVFAGGVFISMMILLTVQALMYSPYSRRYRRSYNW